MIAELPARDLELSHGRVRVVDVGRGPALVLLHGLGGSWQNWQSNIPALAHRHRVIALDLPGFGCSDPYPDSVTMARYSDTLIELLDALGVLRATFVGNSMGGLLTIESAARHPRRVSAAVLVCSGGLPLTSLRHRFVAVPLTRVISNLLRRDRVRRAITRSPRACRLIGSHLVHEPGRVPAELLAIALAGFGARGFGAALDAGLGYDARLRAPLVACPTLVLWGREDRLLPVAMADELRWLIPRSRVEIWDATGHCPMLEDPPRFNELIAGFVGEVSASAGAAGGPSPQPRSGSSLPAS